MRFAAHLPARHVPLAARGARLPAGSLAAGLRCRRSMAWVAAFERAVRERRGPEGMTTVDAGHFADATVRAGGGSGPVPEAGSGGDS